MKINLREEETTSYLSTYQNYLEEIQKLNQKVNEVLNEVMEQSKYDRLQKLISDIIDAYSETIVDNIETGVFTVWKESEGSLRSCLRTYHAGELADEVCAQIEQQMDDTTHDILKIDKAEMIITERPIVSEDGLERLEDICKTAQTQIMDIKADYMSRIESKYEENDIYGTLKPLVVGITSNMESFFEASLHSFENLHEFVRGISLKLHNIADENGVQGKDASLGGAVPGGLNSDSSSGKNIDAFRDITQYIYNTINHEATDNEKALTYELLKEISVVYFQFYKEYGNLLHDRFKSSEEREEFVKQEYILVTRDRNNDQYFDEGDMWTFRSHAHNTYYVFYTVAKMFGNIAEQCKTGKANDVNLLYAAYVLFTPIIEGHIEADDGNKYAEFSKWASEKLLDILGKRKQNESKISIENSDEEQEIEFTGEKFSEDNIQMFVVIVEKIVNQAGVDTLNNSVDKHYNSLVSSRKTYAERRKTATAKEHNIAKNTYGRYTVTNKSIQMMQPECERANSVLEPIDKFYKEKFDSLGKGFEEANRFVHKLSSFIEAWGLGTWDLSKMFSKDESDKSIMEKIQLDIIDLCSGTTAEKIIKGGAYMVKILDWAMPYMKKSKILVRLSEKVWNLTRQDMQIPYVQRLMDQYVMEHYEIKYGMLKGQSGMFEYAHNVATTIEDKHQRRAFENAMFAADTIILQNYIFNTDDSRALREKFLGLFLNLVRSGMCSKQDIESGTSNEIVDKLYNVYVTTENVNPKVEINPDKRRIE